MIKPSTTQNRSYLKRTNGVRYDGVEEFLDEVICGKGKVTRGFLSDLNNIVEGAALDGSIVYCENKELSYFSELPDALRDICDHFEPSDDDIIDYDAVDTRKKAYLDLEKINFGISLFQNNKVPSSLKRKLIETITYIGDEKTLNELQSFNEINVDNVGKYMSLIDNSYSGMNDEFYDYFENTLVKCGVIAERDQYDFFSNIVELEALIEEINQKGICDFKYLDCKAEALAYRDLCSENGYGIRLPFSARHPIYDNLNNPNISYSLYKRIADIHKVKVDELVSYGYSIDIYLPPLLSIFLSRCEKPKDIPRLLGDFREEFSPLRDNVAKYFDASDSELPLREHFEAVKQYKDILNRLSNETDIEKKKSKVYQIWDVVKKGDGFSILTGILDLLIQHDTERVRKRTTGQISNILDKSLNVKNYGRLVSRIFGEDNIDIRSLK